MANDDAPAAEPVEQAAEQAADAPTREKKKTKSKVADECATTPRALSAYRLPRLAAPPPLPRPPR